MIKALYGHPEAGALWEGKLDDIMKDLGWLSIKGTGGVYTHAKTKAAMVVYVDDMLLLASPKDSDGMWRALEKSVCFKDPEVPLSKARRKG